MKAYILMEKGYEYDDNIYNETEGGKPKRVFFKMEDAIEYKYLKEIEKFKSTSLMNYSYDSDQYIRDTEKFEKLRKDLLEKYGEPKYDNKWSKLDEYMLHPNANHEDSMEYLKLVLFSFYEINEVEVDVSSLRGHSIDSVLN